MNEEAENTITVADKFLGGNAQGKLATLELTLSEFEQLDFPEIGITAKHAEVLWKIQENAQNEVPHERLERPLSSTEVDFSLAYGNWAHHREICASRYGGGDKWRGEKDSWPREEVKKSEKLEAYWEKISREKLPDFNVVFILVADIEYGFDTVLGEAIEALRASGISKYLKGDREIRYLELLIALKDSIKDTGH